MESSEITQLLTDAYATKIIIGTFRKPKSAIQLSKEFGIPIAACYRRIRTLEKVGLLKCVDKAISPKGKRIGIYASQLKNAHIYFEDGKIKAKVEFLNGVTKDFHGATFSTVSQ